MTKRYVLLSRSRTKDENLYKYHYSLFENYFELQKHLSKFWWIEKNNYVVFIETDIKKDFSLCGVKKRSLYE